MAPLSLKIIQDGGAVTRMIMFDSSDKVSKAHAIVKEKLVAVDDGKDYGLFLTSAADSLSGVWLEGFRTLDYYMLRDGDSLHYLSRVRNLRVKMLDDTVKTLQVDESKNIRDLMKVICHKVGIINHDEYGLCQQQMAVTEEVKEKPSTGTLTLKRKVVQKERDAKLDQLSKKLKIDDNVHWLDQHRTLREIGVEPNETLLLIRKLYYSDRNIDSRDPVQLNLLYLQTRDAILDGRHPLTQNQANDCKVRWINIRDVNRRILKKSLSNPGQHVRLYKYESELSFMRPFYKDVQIQSHGFESDDNNDNNDDIDNDNQAMDEPDVNINTDEDYVEEKPARKVKKKSTKGRKKKMKRSRSYEEEEPVASVFNDTVVSSELDPSDPVDAFLLSIGATLKTFTPYHLNLAKSKIFSVVQEHDLQQIVQRQRDEPSDVKVSTSDPIFLQ